MHTFPHINAIELFGFDPIWAETEHADTCSQLIHVLRGRLNIRTSQYTLCCRAGDTAYLPANTPHLDECSGEGTFDAYLVRFEWAGENQMLDQFAPRELITIPKATKLRIATEFHWLYQDFQVNPHVLPQMISARVLLIIYSMCREAAIASQGQVAEAENIGRARRLQIVTQAKRIIREEYRKPLTLEVIARVLNMSPYYLSHVFSQESGFTLSNYLTRVRMEQAAELLKDPNLNISEVSYAIGFKDSHYFSQVFRSHFGMSPKSYRGKLALDSNYSVRKEAGNGEENA